ncbi:hypothetical protein TNCV_4376591 [Trichonephila clavipes]|nr:hypothetical protein TNCV_4376591 [Trichonephila clavipes]
MLFNLCYLPLQSKELNVSRRLSFERERKRIKDCSMRLSLALFDSRHGGALWKRVRPPLFAMEAVDGGAESSCFVPAAELSCFVSTAELSCFSPAMVLVFENEFFELSSPTAKLSCFLKNVHKKWKYGNVKRAHGAPY